MTEKAQAKIEELEAQKYLIEIVDEYLERAQRDLNSANTNYDIVYETDEDGNRVTDENGKEKYHWEDRPYTDEEIAASPSIRGRMRAYETIIKALEKMM